jgi:hypothetical protein
MKQLLENKNLDLLTTRRFEYYKINEDQTIYFRVAQQVKGTPIFVCLYA